MVADSQPGHIDQIKQTNAGAVYRLIDQLGPVSRIDLSRLALLIHSYQSWRDFSGATRSEQQAGG